MTKMYAGLSAESPQGSGKGRIPLIVLLQDGASPSTQRIHHLFNLMKSHNHGETLPAKPRTIRLQSILYQVYFSLQDPIITLKNTDLDPHDPHRSACSCKRNLTLI